MKLFLDMDGVLMNFDGHARTFGRHYDGPTYVHLPKEQWTPLQVADDKLCRSIMEQEVFWTTMPPMPDAYELWGWCRPLHHHVLTATPNNAHYRDRCARNKYASILGFFDPVFPRTSFHAVLRKEKREYAYGNVLVDDNQGNCEEWNAAGGTAILHKDAISSIRVLREIFGEP